MKLQYYSYSVSPTVIVTVLKLVLVTAVLVLDLQIRNEKAIIKLIYSQSTTLCKSSFYIVTYF